MATQLKQTPIMMYIMLPLYNKNCFTHLDKNK